MGRKSTKGKEKRMKRKEECAKTAVAQSKVDAANETDDPMSNLAVFKKFARNGLNLDISCHKVADMDEATVDWAFNITKTNMKTLYEKSDWGWNDKQKMEEMTDERSRFLVARDENGKIVAMVHFQFDLEFELEVLYCYEIQLAREVRRKGLGKFLMQILELMALRTEMKKVMLTVFKNNKDGESFFKTKLKYQVDETSPSETYVEAIYDEDGYTYEILSKEIGKKAQPLKSTASQQNATTPVTATS